MYSTIELIPWLQHWVYSNYKKNQQHSNHVLIMTIDNPGWGVTINLEPNFSDTRCLADVENTNVWMILILFGY